MGELLESYRKYSTTIIALTLGSIEIDHDLNETIL